MFGKKPSRRKIEVSMEDAQDGTLGVCVKCGEIQGGCEPDAEAYECDSGCGKYVYGIEEALIRGLVNLADEGGSDDPEERELENM